MKKNPREHNEALEASSLRPGLLVLGRSSPVQESPQNLITGMLESSGIRTVRRDEGPLELDGIRAVWVLGNANWYPRAIEQLLKMPRHQRPPVILWHWERLPPPAASGLRWPMLSQREVKHILTYSRKKTDVYSNYLKLRALHRQGFPDVLVTSTMTRVEFLSDHGITAKFAPLGCAAIHGGDLSLERDVDVLFLGNIQRFSRRARLLRRLRRRGLSVLALGDYHDPSLWGEERNKLLNRTKIYLNIHRFLGEFSGLRMVTGMVNKALIISEPMYKPYPFVPGEHYVSADIEEFPAVVEHYRNNPDERESITERAYRLVTSEVTLAQSVEKVLQWTEAANQPG